MFSSLRNVFKLDNKGLGVLIEVKLSYTHTHKCYRTSDVQGPNLALKYVNILALAE